MHGYLVKLGIVSLRDQRYAYPIREILKYEDLTNFADCHHDPLDPMTDSFVFLSVQPERSFSHPCQACPLPFADSKPSSPADVVLAMLQSPLAKVLAA